MRNESFSFIMRRRLPGLIAAIALIFSGGIACLPDEARVERSIEIKAPIAVIFDHVNDLKKNEAWSPWAAHDETLVASYGAITKGVGATSSWTSENMGSGSMEITKITPNSRIEIALDFEEEGQAQSFWDFEQQGESVKVTWSFLSKPEGFGEKFFALMMDSFVGPYYEEGLAKLKEIAEK